MIDHEFHFLPHLRIGPIINKYGWIISLAEIGDTWFLKWKSPDGLSGLELYPDHDSCVIAIKDINDLSKSL